MKKLLSLLLAVVMAAVLLAGCGGAKPSGGDNTTPTPTPTATPTEKPKVKIGLATDEGGRGDKSFNDAAILGLDKIKSEFGINPTILESKQNDQYEPNLKNLAGANDLVFAVGYKMADAITNVSKAYPNVKFAIVDSAIPQPNVVSILFKENEGSFLAGVLAAKMTKTGKIGFVGGMDGDLIQKFEAGFIAGVKSVNPAYAVDLESRKNVKYADSFSDADKGYELAKSLYNTGIDIIYHASGGVGLGVFRAAKEMNKWAIGVDQDQAVTVPDAAGVILCSVFKKVDTGTYEVSKSVINGTFKGGTSMILGLKENGVGLAPTLNPAVTQEAKDAVKKAQDDIISGKVVAPATLAEEKAFKAPQY